MNKNTHVYSLYALFFCFVIMSYSNLGFYPRWQQPGTESSIAYDVEGYYWYLPSVFIYKNLKDQHFENGVLSKIQSSGNANFENGFIHPQSGHYVLKYTAGMSIMYLPGFAAGHFTAGLLGYPQDGFSAPYKLCLQLWGLLFSFTGLYYLRKLLKIFYEDYVVALVLLLLVLGTNYLNYAAIDVGMSHAWLFTLYVFILLNTQYFYQTYKAKYVIRIGFLIGLVTLIRPTEIIAVLIPLLWGIESWNDLKSRFVLLYQKKGLVFMAVLCGFSVISIQLLYWHYVSGDWIVYSYQDQSFNFRRPHAFVYSWSYRAGWLTYSPMMLLAFIGLLPFLKYGQNKLAVILFFMVNYYIVSAWNIWDYGGFSGRAMIQSYPVILFPIASLIAYVLQKRNSLVVFLPFVFLCLYINIWWTYQAHKGGLVDAFSTTKEYYWKMVGRWSLPEHFQKLKDTDELPDKEPETMSVIYKDSTHTLDGCVDQEHQDYRIITLPYKNTQQEWVRVAADFYCGQKEWNLWEIPQFIVTFKMKDQRVKTRMIRLHRFLNDNQTRNLFIDVKKPLQAFDSVSVALWNAESDKKTCMQHLTISTY